MTPAERAHADRQMRWTLALTVPVYFATWGLVLDGWFIGTAGLAWATALVYAGMHAVENRWRGHCMLSADATAVPAAALVYGAGIAWLSYHFHPELEGWRALTALFAFGSALMAGHVAAFAWAALVGWALERWWTLPPQAPADVPADASADGGREA